MCVWARGYQNALGKTVVLAPVSNRPPRVRGVVLGFTPPAAMLSVPLVVIGPPVSPAPLPTVVIVPARGELLPSGEAEDALAINLQPGFGRMKTASSLSAKR